MSSVFTVRPEVPDDRGAIYDLNVAAFERRTEEADLVDALREDGDLLLSLVAVAGEEIVGHVAFSRVIIDTPEGPEGGVVLAPVGVAPDRQGQEVGTRLIESGLEQLAARIGITQEGIHQPVLLLTRDYGDVVGGGAPEQIAVFSQRCVDVCARIYQYRAIVQIQLNAQFVIVVV